MVFTYSHTIRFPWAGENLEGASALRVRDEDVAVRKGLLLALHRCVERERPGPFEGPEHLLCGGVEPKDARITPDLRLFQPAHWRALRRLGSIVEDEERAVIEDVGVVLAQERSDHAPDDCFVLAADDRERTRALQRDEKVPRLDLRDPLCQLFRDELDVVGVEGIDRLVFGLPRFALQENVFIAALQYRIDDVDLFEHLSFGGRDVQDGVFVVYFTQVRALSLFVVGKRQERSIGQRQDRVMRHSLEQPHGT